MKIESTEIPDIQPKYIDQRKVDFANKVIEHTTPLIKDLTEQRQNTITILKHKQTNKRNMVSIEKEKVQSEFEDYQQEKQKTIFLNKVEVLKEKGAMSDPGIKNELIVMLKTLDTVSKESVNRYKKQVETYLSKRF